MEQANALRNLSSQLLSFSSSSNSRVPQIGHADMSSGTRSTKRSQLLASTVPADPYAQLMHMCSRSGEHAYRLPAHGRSNALVDLDAVKLLCDVLRPRLESAHVTVDAADLALQEIESITGPAATSAGLREWMERLRVWEQEQAAVVGEGADRSRVHMYASAVSAALVSRTVDTHGILSAGAKASYTLDGEEFELTANSRASLSWMCALSGRYTFLGSPKSYIDPLSMTRATSERTAAADVNSRAMCTWREKCNAIVDEHVPAAERKFVHLALDQFAVCSGPDAAKQGGPRASYILAHSTKPGEKHKSNDMYNAAFKVAIRQLKAYDEMYKLRRSDALFDDEDDNSYTSLAEHAEKAWEGPDAINGKSTTALIPFATTSLYFGRSFPLSLLSDTLPTEFAHYVIIIWLCPRLIWLTYFATPLVFSVVDSVFCGYVPTNAKATVNHMIDSNGARADLDRILHETRYGTAFYHSDSQPQQDVEVEDGEAGDSDQHTSSSPYVQVRARSIISKEVRDQLLAERGEFRKAFREYLGKYLAVRPVGLATW